MSDLETDACPPAGAAAPGARKRTDADRDKVFQQKQENVAMDDKGNIHYTSPNFEAKINLIGGVQNLQIGPNNVMVLQQTSRQKKSIKATKPLSVSTEELTADQHMQISKHLGKQWRQLGRALGFSDGELDNVHVDFRLDGSQEVSYQMIRQWKQKMVDMASVAAMAKALNAVGRGDLSDMLHE